MTDEYEGRAMRVIESDHAEQRSMSVFNSMQAFADAQRVASALSSSSLVPQDYRGNIANTLVALEMAQRTGSSPMAVMQNMHVIHGRPSWSSQFVIAALNSCGRFSPLRFVLAGEGDQRGCYAWAVDRDLNERIEGPLVTIEMAKKEGWFSKNGSKWQTMPELMLRYRAAKFFGNLYAPDVLMGMSTADESEDIGATPRSIKDVNGNGEVKLPGSGSATTEPASITQAAKAATAEPEEKKPRGRPAKKQEPEPEPEPVNEQPAATEESGDDLF